MVDETRNTNGAFGKDGPGQACERVKRGKVVTSPLTHSDSIPTPLADMPFPLSRTMTHRAYSLISDR